MVSSLSHYIFSLTLYFSLSMALASQQLMLTNRDLKPPAMCFVLTSRCFLLHSVGSNLPVLEIRTGLLEVDNGSAFEDQFLSFEGSVLFLSCIIL